MKQLENNLYIAAQITEKDIQTLADEGVKIIINNRPDNEETQQITHQEAKKIANQLGLDYYYLPMENGKPITAETLSQFKQLISSSKEKICAHCRTGMRCTILWAITQLEDGNKTIDEVISLANNINIPLEKARPLLEHIG